MKSKVQNLAPYAIESMAPGETADVERTDDIDRLIEAGSLAVIEPKKAAK